MYARGISGELEKEWVARPMEMGSIVKWKRWLAQQYRTIRESFDKSLAPKGSLGVLAMMKNETDVLKEWLEHYQWQGVDRVFLIDNGSTDNPMGILRPFIEAGFVEYFVRPEPHRQVPHMREVYKSADIPRKVEWLVMADLDEFWYAPTGDLKAAIAEIQIDFDLVYARWIMFGSSGHELQPSSVREGFIHRWKELGGHRSTKWICRTHRLKSWGRTNQHKVWGIDSRRVVIDDDLFRLNHYPIMSRDYFRRVKMTRGDVATANSDSVRTWEYFETYDKPAVVVDTTLCEMVRSRRG